MILKSCKSAEAIQDHTKINQKPSCGIRRPPQGLLAWKSNFWFPPPILLPRGTGEAEKLVDTPPQGGGPGGGGGGGKRIGSPDRTGPDWTGFMMKYMLIIIDIHNFILF